MTCLAFLGSGSVQAQPKTVSVGFTNQTKMDVKVQGYTIFNKTPRAGATLSIDKSGGKAFETNVPAGNFRFYTVHDANFNVLLKDFQVPIQNRNVTFNISVDPNDAKKVIIRFAGN